jgi:hypothetical protein
MSSAERRAFSQLAMSSLRDCVSQAVMQWQASLSGLDTRSEMVDQKVSFMQYQQCPCCNVLKSEPERDNGPIADEPLFWFTVRFLHQEGGCRPLVPLPVRYNLPLFLGILLRDFDVVRAARTYVSVCHGSETVSTQSCIRKKWAPQPALSDFASEAIFNQFKAQTHQTLAGEVQQRRSLLYSDVSRVYPGFDEITCPPSQVNPRFGIPKADEPGVLRIIDHASWHKNSINAAHISSACKYCTGTEARDMLQNLPTSVFLAKADLAKAYKSKAVSVSQLPLNCFWGWGTHSFNSQGIYSFRDDDLYGGWRIYTSCTLFFGLGDAPAEFSSISNALCRMLIRCRIDSLVMIDDFLFAGERLQTQSDLEFLIREFGRLGLEVKPGKTEWGPAVTFLGVLYNVPRQTAYMTAARLAKHALLLQHISDSLSGLTDKVHTAVVASFVHVALFSAPVVDGGRLHLDALLAVANSDCVTVSWTPAMQEEVYFWEKLVPVIHGACWSKAESRRLIPEGHVSSDASFEPLSSSGYGFHWQGQVRHRIFSKEQLQYFLSCQPINPIAILELFALVQSIRCFGAQWQGC